MNPIRKLAVWYTIRLLVGIGMLAMMWEIRSTLAFIAGMAGALLAFWNLILLTSLAEAHSALKYPEYNLPVTSDSRLEKWMHHLSYFFFYITILAFGVTGPPLENHINCNMLLFTYGLTGAAIASAALYFLKQILPGYFKNNQKRAIAILGLWVSIAVCTILAAGHFNKGTAKEKLMEQSAYVLRKSKNVSTNSHYLYLKLGTNEERFTPNANEWNKISEGDSLLLTIGTGSLNYSYIFHFSPNH